MSYSLTIKSIPKKGRGVFAEKSFKKGEIVEICPVVIVSKKEYPSSPKSILTFYLYPWKKGDYALVLGYGSVYNHSYTPNVDWNQNFNDLTFSLTALTDIKVGEELTVNYNGDVDPEESVDWMFDMPQRS